MKFVLQRSLIQFCNQFNIATIYKRFNLVNHDKMGKR